MTTEKDLSSLLRSLEEQLLQPATRGSAEAIAKLLAEDFREFGSSGRSYNRQQIIAELAAASSRTISLKNFQCDLIAPEIALVTYQSVSFPSGLKGGEASLTLRSSLWRLRDDRWQMVFHQGTGMPPA